MKPATPPQRSPRRGRRKLSTPKAEERTNGSGVGADRRVLDAPRQRIADLSDEDRKEYFREKKRLSRARLRPERQDWEPSEERISALVRRYEKLPLRIFLLDGDEETKQVGFSIYTGKRFSHVIMDLHDLLRHKLLPENPVLIYFGYPILLIHNRPFLILAEANAPLQVHAIMITQARRWFPMYSDHVLWFLGEVPVSICNGQPCISDEAVSRGVVFCAHIFKESRILNYMVPCVHCLFGDSLGLKPCDGDDDDTG